ncbi:MAG TPA: hypothetical protein GXX20_07165 [Clostridiaceae bacterium]|nr:hypothetical protein [Clostridiaceae bacterium]
MEYRISVRNNWWFDAGIVGLYYIASRLIKDEKCENICLAFDSDSLVIQGENEEKIREFLQHCYDNLAFSYWNVSTKSQKEKLELVVYNQKTGELSLAPRRNPTPVVGMFVKGSSWKAEYINYDNIMDKSLKTRVDNYLKETGRSLWGKKKALLLTLPECHPKIKILPKENIKRQTTCSVCGKLSSNCNEISQPSFFLFASKNATQSFHTQGNKPAKICWECELISKFTMETINYRKDGSSLSILLLNSPNLEHNINCQKKIGCSSVLRGIDEEYFYKNIGLNPEGLISKAKMSYELLWAYFVDSYNVLKSNSIDIEQNGSNLFYGFIEDIITAPIEIIVLVLDEKGQTFFTKEMIYYNDVCYAYRLITHFLEKGVDIKKFYNSLYETDSNGNLLPSRNKILRKILNRHCILSDIEGITIRKSLNNEFINVSSLLNPLIEYYLIIKEDIMNRDQIEVAVNLGKQIIYQPYVASGENEEILKKIKGDLYMLRKSRTVTDFITQINTLQFRYGISVSNKILEGILNEVPFEDFKAYCIMGALNNYNYYFNKKKEDKKDE